MQQSKKVLKQKFSGVKANYVVLTVFRAQLVVIVTNCLHSAAVTDLLVQTEIAARKATSTFHITSSFFDAMISSPSC